MTAYDEGLITRERTSAPPQWYRRRPREGIHQFIGTPTRRQVLHVGMMFFDARKDTTTIALEMGLPESTVYRALIMFRQEREKGTW